MENNINITGRDNKIIPIAKPQIGIEELENVKDVLLSGKLAQGEYVADFEKKFASYIGVKYAIATNSGTSALHTALASIGVKKEEQVITSDFSFLSSASSIIMQGAKPIFCDIDPDNYNISNNHLRQKINKKTSAIIPVHLYGQPCEMDEIMEIAKENNLIVIEDACQAHGAEYKNKKVGSIGNIGVFSFYPTKNITTGEGGMLTTNNEDIARKARMFRNHGQTKRYSHDFLGYNYRMTDIAAAIGIVQLEKLDSFNKKRKENAMLLTKELKDIKGLITPFVKDYVNHVFHQYTIRLENIFPVSRDKLANNLKENNIGFGIYYPKPIHRQGLLEKLGYTDENVNCPNSIDISEKVLSLPIHPAVSKKDIKKIAEVIKLVGEQKIWMSA